jgi:hypothetical protein
MLRLLESYVLWSIGQLPETDANLLRQMTPKLQAVYKVQGDWPQIVSTVMQLPPNLPATLIDLWTKNTEIARQHKMTLAPLDFAKMFVDQNLAG